MRSPAAISPTTAISSMLKDETAKHQSGASPPEPPVISIPAGKLPALAILDIPTVSTGGQLILEGEPFPHNLPRKLQIFRGPNGNAYAIRNDAPNRYALAVGSNQLNNWIRALARAEGILLRRSDLNEINHSLRAFAEMAAKVEPAWYRVAEIVGGIEIDLGDDQHTRVRVTAGQVSIVKEGSTTLFYRTRMSQPMVMPASSGDIGLLKKYLNLHPVSIMLFTGWLTYTLAHPKVPATKFVILILKGNQGSGKTLLCYIAKKLIDPGVVGVQILPSNVKDLAIDAQSGHLLCYDNVREFRANMADVLCVAATGGALTTRQLYSDAEVQIHHLHVALVLNGIHSFIGQPDLAQRCLPIELLPIVESGRKSEAQFMAEFQADLPAIQRGLFDLIADILKHLPSAKVTDPERMIDFVKWLAAMEMAHGAPPGVYQGAYSEALNQGQLDSIQDDSLAAAVVEFADDEIPDDWTGRPSDLLAKLNLRASKGTLRARDWPQNAISLSKKLIPLQASLLTQGIRVELRRGKERMVTIKNEGAISERF